MAISDYAPVGLGNSGARGGSSFTCKEAHKVAVDNPGVGHGFGPASEATRDRGGLNRGRPLGWQIGKGMARSGGWRIVGRERTTGRKARENWRGRPSDQVLQSSETVANEEEKFFFIMPRSMRSWRSGRHRPTSTFPRPPFSSASASRLPPALRPSPAQPFDRSTGETRRSQAHPLSRTTVLQPTHLEERRLSSPFLSESGGSPAKPFRVGRAGEGGSSGEWAWVWVRVLV